MESLLPSEIARLVYGYLKDEQCYEAAEKFLETSSHLSECHKIAKQGRRFHTRVLGRSLVDMCDVFSTVYSVVQERVENSQDIATNAALFNQLQQFLNLNSSSKNVCSNVTSNAVATSSKEDEVDGRYVGSSVLRPHATSTPYSNVLSNICYGDKHATPSSSAANNSVRRQLLSEKEKENERVVNNNEVLQVYIDSLNRTLMDSSQIHEKLAEKINEKIVTVENQPPDTIAKTIVTECDFDRFVDEIMESANPYESKSKDHNPFRENNCKLLDNIENVEGLSIESNKGAEILRSPGGCSQPDSEGDVVSVDEGNAEAVDDSFNNQNKLPNEHSEVLGSLVTAPTDIPTSSGAAIITSFATASTITTTTVTTIEASTSSVVTVTAATVNNETTVVSGSLPQPSDSSKNIIEEAMRSSFISPVKHNSPNNQSPNCNKVNFNEDNNSNKSYEFVSNECFNNESNILNSTNQNQEHYPNASSVILNSFPALAPSNFILTSPVALPVNIVSQAVTKPMAVSTVPASIVNILTTAVQNTPSIVTTPAPAGQILPVLSPVAISSVENGCSSSRIFTNSSMVQPIFPAPRSIAPKNTTGSDSQKPSKILLENVSWRTKSKLHVRARNKVMRKKLTKISPKPNFVYFQETICKPGIKKVLPNGVTVEVLPQDTVFPAVSERIENIDKTDDIHTNILEEEKYNGDNSTKVNDSDLMVIDTSLSEILDNHVQSHVTAEVCENSVKEVEKLAEQLSDKGTNVVANAGNQENSIISCNPAEIEILADDLGNVDKPSETNSLLPNNDDLSNKTCSASLNVDVDIKTCSVPLSNDDVDNKTCSVSLSNDDVDNKTCSVSLNNDDEDKKTCSVSPNDDVDKFSCTSVNDVKSSSLTKKDRTPGMKACSNKRRSMSTPRRRINHIRALDFGTPDRRPKPRKTNTSPRSSSRLKAKLGLSKGVRSGLFRSPENKIISSSKKCEIIEEETASKDCNNTQMTDSLSRLSEKNNTISSCTEPHKDNVSNMDNISTFTEKTQQLHLVADTSSKTPPIKKSNLNSDSNSTKNTPAKICKSVDSPMPKLAADWDAVNGLGMIVGKNSPSKNENKSTDVSIVKKSWDANLRSFIDPNSQIVCSSPKRKHARRKIGSKLLNDTKDVLRSDNLCEKHNVIQNEDNEDFKKGATDKNVTDRKVKKNNQKKKSVDKKRNNKGNRRLSVQPRLVVTRSSSKNKNLKKDFDLTDESSLSCTSSDESSDGSSSTIQNNDVSSDLAEKIERNILSFDTQSSDKKISSEANCSSNVEMLCNRSTEKDCSTEEQNSNVEEKSTNSGELTKGKYLSPEDKIFKGSNLVKPSNCQHLPILDTPIKSGVENMPPQTPILDTPMLKAIQKDTEVLLLTPYIPPTPAAAKAKVISEKEILSNISGSNSDTTPEKNIFVSMKNKSPSKEMSVVCKEKETCTKNQKHLESAIDQKGVGNSVVIDPGTILKFDKLERSIRSKYPVVSCQKIDSNQHISSEGESNENNKNTSPKKSCEKLKEVLQPAKETSMKNTSSENEKDFKLKSSKEKKKKKKREKIMKKSKNELISELLKSAEQRFFEDNSSISPDSENEEHSRPVNKQSFDSDKISCSSAAIEKSNKTDSSITGRADDEIIKCGSVSNSVTSVSNNDTASFKKTCDKPTDASVSNKCSNNSNFETIHNSVISVAEASLKKCDVSSSESKIPPKPKKYVKTILLSSKVSKKESPEKPNFTSQKFEISKKDSENEIESQRTLLNEKRQRTIDRLKQVSVKTINENNYADSKRKEKGKTNLSGKGKRGRKVLPIKNVENSIESCNPEKKSNNEINLSPRKILKDSSDVFEPKKGSKIEMQSNYKSKSSLPGSSVEREHDKISTVQKENSTSSPCKIINSEKETLKLPANKSQIIYLQSNEAYLHVVYDEDTVKTSVKKSYEGIDNFEMTVFSGDDDNYCKINMQPLQTLLEILPHNRTSIENQHLKTTKSYRIEEDSPEHVKNRHRSDKYYEIKNASQHLSSVRDTKDKRWSTGESRRLSSLDRRRRSPSMDKNSGFFSSKPFARGRKHSRYSSRSFRNSRTSNNPNYFSRRNRSPSIDKRSKSRDRKSRTFDKRRDSKSRSPSPGRRRLSPFADSNFKIAKSPPRSNFPSSSSFTDRPSCVDKTNESSKISSSTKIKTVETKDIVSTSFDKTLNLKNKLSTRSPNRNNTSKKHIDEVKSKLHNIEDLEEGEVVSLCGNDDNRESSEKETSLGDLMDFAVSTKISMRRSTSCKSPGKLQSQTPRKRKASDDLVHGIDKKHKSDDAQRLLKNLDSEDLEQFLSAVHSETEK